MSSRTDRDWDAYRRDCERWAREQGLTDPAELLAAAEIDATFEHVGGNVMVLTIDAGPDHVVCLTVDGCDDEPYLLCLTRRDDPEPIDGYRSTPLAEVVDTVREMLAALPAPNPADALTFDEAEAAGVDGTLRS